MVCFQFHLKPHFKIVIVAGIASTVSACGGGGGGGDGGSVGGGLYFACPSPSQILIQVW